VLVRGTRSKILIVIVCAFAVTALGFLAASVASYTVASDIDKATSDLLTNALPSVRELTRARTALRELRVSASVTAAARPPRDMGGLDRLWKELDGAVTRATATPWYEGERALYDGRVLPSLEAFGHAVDEFERFAAAPPGDPGLLRAAARLKGAADQADDALEDLSELNGEQAFAATARIARARQYAARATLYLDILSTVVALIAAVLAIEVTQQFAKVMRRNLVLEGERAEQLDLVAQRVAHDLLSPLAAVSLSLGTVQRKHKDEETTRVVERAQRALERSRRMVQGIYAFARLSGKPTGEAVAPLRAAVLDAASALQTAEGEAGPSVDVQGFDEVDVKMDRGMLDVVLSNLLSNASKFMADAPVRRITVRADVDARRVHVEVEDTGPGVPERFAQMIFEPYKRAPGTTQPGLGLGLATVKRLIEGHGGAVGVRNAPAG
jgi:signal transduction histidine kinase